MPYTSSQMSGIICELLHHVSRTCTSDFRHEVRCNFCFGHHPMDAEEHTKVGRLSKNEPGINKVINNLLLSNKFCENWFVNLPVRLVAFKELGRLN